MKAITLYQPYASLVVCGLKQYETRSWATEYRGRLAIHAAKKEPDQVWEEVRRAWEDGKYNPFWNAIRLMGYSAQADLPRGAILGTVMLGEIYPTDNLQPMITRTEAAFGNWGSGRFAWQLSRAIRFTEPIPARGRQGLWEWTATTGTRMMASSDVCPPGARVNMPDAIYELALRFVDRVDWDLTHGTGHYRDRSGCLLRSLDQVVEAALREQLVTGGNGHVLPG